MTHEPKQGRIADLPLEERQVREIEEQRQIREGIASRHLATSAYEHAYAADQFARALRMGRAERR